MMLLNSKYKYCFMQSQSPGASCISWSTCSFTSAIPGDLNVEVLPTVSLNLSNSNSKHKKKTLKKSGNRLELADTEGKMKNNHTWLSVSWGSKVVPFCIPNPRILDRCISWGITNVSPSHLWQHFSNVIPCIHVGLAHKQLNQPRPNQRPYLGTGDWTCSDAAPIAPGLLVIEIPSRLPKKG